MSKEKVINNLKNKIAIENFIQADQRNKKIKKILQSTLTVAICSFSVTGMVFAKDISTRIYNNFFLTGEGMGTAMSEGYIENTDMEYKNSEAIIENEETGQKIDAGDTKMKVSEFVMDDFNLSITFDVELSENAKEIVKTEEVWSFNFPDLVISDENNIVLYCPTGMRYDEFSKENQLGLSYNEALDTGKWIGSGVNTVPIGREDNHVKVVYNIYTGGESKYPKSKKLNIDMTQIKISNQVEVMMGDEEITLTGDWNFTVNVPEKMYNRKNITYKQISTTNPDFNVLQASVYDTGTDLKIKFKAQKHGVEPTTEKIEFWKSLPQDSDLRNVDILNYIEREIRYTKEYKEYMEREFSIWEYDKYITNENGQKFEMSVGPKENGGGYIDDDGIYESNCTFDLTKYDATNTITVYIDYQGNKAEIVLEKVEE